MIKEKLKKFNSQVITDSYDLFGSFLKGDTALFRVWAPNAKAVSVVGDFNGWNNESNPMLALGDGVWETKIKGLKNFDSYKYAVTRIDGSIVLKSDPYARHFETAPANASKLYKADGYRWNDGDWREAQKGKNIYESPVNIYEVHAGSWRRFSDGNTFDYVKLAEELAEYVKKMHYTHIELMPITEYPYEGISSIWV